MRPFHSPSARDETHRRQGPRDLRVDEVQRSERSPGSLQGQKRETFHPLHRLLVGPHLWLRHVKSPESLDRVEVLSQSNVSIDSKSSGETGSLTLIQAKP
jgi:hypothetical protein